MAMLSVAAARWRLTGNRLAGSARPFSDGKGKVLSEEELAAEKIYIQKEKMEKMKHKADKEKAQKDREDEQKKA